MRQRMVRKRKSAATEISTYVARWNEVIRIEGRSQSFIEKKAVELGEEKLLACCRALGGRPSTCSDQRLVTEYTEEKARAVARLEERRDHEDGGQDGSGGAVRADADAEDDGPPDGASSAEQVNDLEDFGGGLGGDLGGDLDMFDDSFGDVDDLVASSFVASRLS